MRLSLIERLKTFVSCNSFCADLSVANFGIVSVASDAPKFVRRIGLLFKASLRCVFGHGLGSVLSKSAVQCFIKGIESSDSQAREWRNIEWLVNGRSSFSSGIAVNSGGGKFRPRPLQVKWKPLMVSKKNNRLSLANICKSRCCVFETRDVESP